jgi:predicted TPR repeat methyltransferase
MNELSILTQINPTYPAGWFYKGKVHHLKGQKAEAKAAYEQTLRLDDNYEQARDGLQELKE